MVSGAGEGAAIENIAPVRSMRVDGPGAWRISKFSTKSADTMCMSLEGNGGALRYNGPGNHRSKGNAHGFHTSRTPVRDDCARTLLVGRDVRVSLRQAPQGVCRHTEHARRW